MRKTVTVLAVLAIASIASAETMWAVSDDYVGTPESKLFSFEHTTGVAGTVWDLNVIMKSTTVYGMAIAGDVAFMSYYNSVRAQRAFAAFSLSSGTVLTDVDTGGVRFRGMTWDGAKLYGNNGGSTNEIDEILLSGLTYAGKTQVATTTGAFGSSGFWAAMPGYNPATGEYFTWTGQRYFEGITFSGTTTYTGGTSPDDYMGAMAFTNSGVMVGSYATNYNTWVGINPYTGNPASPISYSFTTVNPGLFAGTGVYAMSNVGPAIPEPATMGLLLCGGLGAILRKRR